MRYRNLSKTERARLWRNGLGTDPEVTLLLRQWKESCEGYRARYDEILNQKAALYSMPRGMRFLRNFRKA